MENIFPIAFFSKRNKTVSGFTLLEVLIVIAIIGILVSVGVASYSYAQKRARDSARREHLRAVQGAWEQFYADNDNSYPATCGFSANPTAGVMSGTYLPGGLPTDPRNTEDFEYDFSDSHCSSSSYCFCAHLELEGGNAADDAGNETCTYGTGEYYCVGALQ
jgi:prepilin-type N-terminal cleavage/methylation domain-containing protein